MESPPEGPRDLYFQLTPKAVDLGLNLEACLWLGPLSLYIHLTLDSIGAFVFFFFFPIYFY